MEETNGVWFSGNNFNRHLFKSASLLKVGMITVNIGELESI
jgi:hypothetical protein